MIKCQKCGLEAKEVLCGTKCPLSDSCPLLLEHCCVESFNKEISGGNLS
jgi:hypothetical protein